MVSVKTFILSTFNQSTFIEDYLAFNVYNVTLLDIVIYWVNKPDCDLDINLSSDLNNELDIDNGSSKKIIILGIHNFSYIPTKTTKSKI